MKAADKHTLVDVAPARPRALRLPLNLSERKVLLGIVDLLGVNAALLISVWLRSGSWSWTTIVENPSWFVTASGLWLMVAFLLNAYNLRRAARLGPGVATGALAGVLTGSLYLLIPYVTPPLPASRSMLVTLPILILALISVWRAIYPLVLVHPQLRRRALVFGAGWSGRVIATTILENAASEYEIIGFLDDNARKHQTSVCGLPVLGDKNDLSRLVVERGASDIILAITQPDLMHPELFQTIMDCHERGITVTHMPVLYEQLMGRVAVEHAGRNLFVVLPIGGAPSRLHQASKRVFDLVIAFLGIAMLTVLVPLVALALRFDSPGPVIFRQPRVGRGGRTFELLKFRTMGLDAESDGPRWAEERDQRVTRVGRYLRRLHLDEVPQALNILRGDLSFIGPRPERPEFVARLEREIPFYRARLAVRPGITGWAQVNYPYAASVEDALTKLQYDLYYVKHQSPWLDLNILLQTIGLVAAFRGR